MEGFLWKLDSSPVVAESTSTIGSVKLSSAMLIPKSWRQRYFILTLPTAEAPAELKYAKTEPSAEQDSEFKTIPLAQVTRVQWHEDRKNGRRFDLYIVIDPALPPVDNNVRLLKLRAEERSEARKWTECLSSVLQETQKKKNIHGSISFLTHSVSFSGGADFDTKKSKGSIARIKSGAREIISVMSALDRRRRANPDSVQKFPDEIFDRNNYSLDEKEDSESKQEDENATLMKSRILLLAEMASIPAKVSSGKDHTMNLRTMIVRLLDWNSTSINGNLQQVRWNYPSKKYRRTVSADFANEGLLPQFQREGNVHLNEDIPENENCNLNSEVNGGIDDKIEDERFSSYDDESIPEMKHAISEVIPRKKKHHYLTRRANKERRGSTAENPFCIDSVDMFPDVWELITFHMRNPVDGVSSSTTSLEALFIPLTSSSKGAPSVSSKLNISPVGFSGQDLLDWLLHHKLFQTKTLAQKFCTFLLKIQIIMHSSRSRGASNALTGNQPQISAKLGSFKVTMFSVNHYYRFHEDLRPWHEESELRKKVTDVSKDQINDLDDVTLIRMIVDQLNSTLSRGSSSDHIWKWSLTSFLVDYSVSFLVHTLWRVFYNVLSSSDHAASIGLLWEIFQKESRKSHACTVSASVYCEVCRSVEKMFMTSLMNIFHTIRGSHSYHLFSVPVKDVLFKIMYGSDSVDTFSLSRSITRPFLCDIILTLSLGSSAKSMIGALRDICALLDQKDNVKALTLNREWFVAPLSMIFFFLKERELKSDVYKEEIAILAINLCCVVMWNKFFFDLDYGKHLRWLVFEECDKVRDDHVLSRTLLMSIVSITHSRKRNFPIEMNLQSLSGANLLATIEVIREILFAEYRETRSRGRSSSGASAAQSMLSPTRSRSISPSQSHGPTQNEIGSFTLQRITEITKCEALMLTATQESSKSHSHASSMEDRKSLSVDEEIKSTLQSDSKPTRHRRTNTPSKPGISDQLEISFELSKALIDSFREAFILADPLQSKLDLIEKTCTLLKGYTFEKTVLAPSRKDAASQKAFAAAVSEHMEFFNDAKKLFRFLQSGAEKNSSTAVSTMFDEDTAAFMKKFQSKSSSQQRQELMEKYVLRKVVQ